MRRKPIWRENPLAYWLAVVLGTLAAVLIFAPPSFGQTNLVTNSGFESGNYGGTPWNANPAGWFTNAGATLTGPHDGPSGGKERDWYGHAVMSNASANYQGAGVPVNRTWTAGTPYTFSLLLYKEAGPTNLQLFAGAPNSNSTFKSVSVVQGAWNRFFVTWTPNATYTGNAYFGFRNNNGQGFAQTVAFDAVLVAQGTSTVYPGEFVGKTEVAQGVDHMAADLRGQAACNPVGSTFGWSFWWRPVGGAWRESIRRTGVSCSTLTARTFSVTATNLAPSTTYQFTLCVYQPSERCFGRDGNVQTTSTYETFTTAPAPPPTVSAGPHKAGPIDDGHFGPVPGLPNGMSEFPRRLRVPFVYTNENGALREGHCNVDSYATLRYSNWYNRYLLNGYSESNCFTPDGRTQWMVGGQERPIVTPSCSDVDIENQAAGGSMPPHTMSAVEGRRDNGRSHLGYCEAYKIGWTNPGQYETGDGRASPYTGNWQSDAKVTLALAGGDTPATTVKFGRVVNGAYVAPSSYWSNNNYGFRYERVGADYLLAHVDNWGVVYNPTEQPELSNNDPNDYNPPDAWQPMLDLGASGSADGEEDGISFALSRDWCRWDVDAHTPDYPLDLWYAKLIASCLKPVSPQIRAECQIEMAAGGDYEISNIAGPQSCRAQVGWTYQGFEDGRDGWWVEAHWWLTLTSEAYQNGRRWRSGCYKTRGNGSVHFLISPGRKVLHCWFFLGPGSPADG